MLPLGDSINNSAFRVIWKFFKLVTIIQLKSGPIVCSGEYNLLRQKTNKRIWFELQRRQGICGETGKDRGKDLPHKEIYKNLHFQVNKLTKVSYKKFRSANSRFK